MGEWRDITVDGLSGAEAEQVSEWRDITVDLGWVGEWRDITVDLGWVRGGILL